MDFLTRIFHPPPERNVAYIIGASVITTVAVLKVSQLAFQGKQVKIIRSPRETQLPRLSGKEIKALAYPPDILPGGRDVESPVCEIRCLVMCFSIFQISRMMLAYLARDWE
jgi:hypothetical protein